MPGAGLLSASQLRGVLRSLRFLRRDEGGEKLLARLTAAMRVDRAQPEQPEHAGVFDVEALFHLLCAAVETQHASCRAGAAGGRGGVATRMATLARELGQRLATNRWVEAEVEAEAREQVIE